jgi:hypothetical protein
MHTRLISPHSSLPSRRRSWYAYVIELCFNVVTNGFEAFFLLLFYHISLFFLLWSYYKTIFTKISLVPTQFKISRAEMEQLTKVKSPEEQTRFLKHLSKDLPILNCTINNCVRFCERCQVRYLPSIKFSL